MHPYDTIASATALVDYSGERCNTMNGTSDFKEFLHMLGLLHDVVIDRLVWMPEARKLEFEVDDIYSNFGGLPEYPGAKPATIVLNGVERVCFDIDTDEPRLYIFEFEVEQGDGVQDAVITFRPSGKIRVTYKSADFPSNVALKKFP